MNARNPITAKASPTEVTYTAFGEDVTLSTHATIDQSHRRLRDLKDIHIPALASRVLPRAGLCMDLGAGEGWFGIAFARAFPEWTVICLEHDADMFDLLEQNVSAQQLRNVICVRAALHPDTPFAGQTRPRNMAEPLPDLESLKALRATRPADFVPLAALRPLVAPATSDTPKAERQSYPALSPEVLRDLRPDLLKIDAPLAEAAIGAAIKDAPVGHLIGQLYTYVPAEVFNPGPDAGPREFYLPYRQHVLRRDYEDNFETRQSRLDVVVAMYNTTDYIKECVDSLLANEDSNVRILVVDDGSTDGCGDLVARLYEDQPRVTLLRKANGGCASARNYGRMHSNATHIAFVDADDRVDPDMFSGLFQIARYTGAPVTEAEFKPFEVDERGQDVFSPSYEAEIYALPGNERLGPYEYSWIQGIEISHGQPSIWRRVHRRDFLDRNNIWFPEHIRAFDDQIFQLLIAQYSGAIAHLRGLNYHYRQHPGQDIKQGDERHFYSFNMFRKIVIRSLDEGWNNMNPFFASVLNTMGWAYPSLPANLQLIYSEAASEFLAILSKTYDHKFSSEDLARTHITGLDIMVGEALRKLGDGPPNFSLIRLENWRWQPEFIRMQQRL